MDQQILSSLSKEIYRRYPEFRGIKPKLQLQQGSNLPVKIKPTYLVTFHKNEQITPTRKIARWVRVITDDQGQILKITTSR
jgi:hypothetical protein